MRKDKKWPEACAWPAPLPKGSGTAWDADTVDPFSLDADGEEMLAIKDYFDSLVEEGRLNPDYSLNADYDDEAEDEEFTPEQGEEYWVDDRFLIEIWEDDLAEYMNCLKIDVPLTGKDPVIAVREVCDYTFINENLLRQAFTRRAFALEYGLDGCSEELEFFGDSVLNLCVTKELSTPLTEVNVAHTEAPFRSEVAEGELTKIRSHYISKEYLSGRCVELGLDQLILYGTGEEPTESSREDAMEALIGAVAIDCNWNWETIESVVDRLICVQQTNPRQYLRKTYYEIFNAWHQKQFGCIPEYEITGHAPYQCSMRFSIPDNNLGIRTAQRIHIDAESRSDAREQAATIAFAFVTTKGLWVNLKDANMEPNWENSINQLQELYQKKYLESPPTYDFEELPEGAWHCTCVCNSITGSGQGSSKTKAKKNASFDALVHLFQGAGICKPEWLDKVFQIQYQWNDIKM